MVRLGSDKISLDSGVKPVGAGCSSTCSKHVVINALSFKSVLTTGVSASDACQSGCSNRPE